MLKFCCYLVLSSDLLLEFLFANYLFDYLNSRNKKKQDKRNSYQIDSNQKKLFTFHSISNYNEMVSKEKKKNKTKKMSNNK